MKKVLKFLLPAMAVAFFLGAIPSQTQAQDIIRQILNRMDANNKSLKSLKSKVQMANTDAGLGETDLKEGELHYLPGRSENQVYVRINWSKPREEQLAVANGKYVLYRPALKQAITGTVDNVKNKNSKAGGVLAFMGMTKAQMSENYDIKYLGDETVKSGQNTFHLLLTPKKPTSYKSADLWVDSNGMPIQAKIVEKNNDSTTILLSDIQRNATVNANVFKISPPKGTAIIQG